MKKKIRVLFLQSKSQTWSITDVHSMLMQHFDRENIEIHVECNVGPRGEKTTAYQKLESTPEVHMRPTTFGPVIFQGSTFDVAKNLISTGIAVPGSIAGLRSYVKQQQIDIIHASQIPRDAVSGVFLARLTGTKSVVHLHSKCGDWMRPSVFRAMRQA